MSRARVVAVGAGVASGPELAIVAAWFVVLHDTAEPLMWWA